MSYTIYQLKFIIEKWLEENPEKKIKGWKSGSKIKLLEIIKNNKIRPNNYAVPIKNPNPPKKAVQNVLKKYGKTKHTEEEQKEYLIEDKKHKNPLLAIKDYVNKEGEIEKIKLVEHQTKFIKQFVYSNLRGAVAFHGVGSGKTLTAVVSAYLYLKMYPDNKVIVISPSALLYNFINGMEQYGVNISDSRYSFYTYDKYVRRREKDLKNEAKDSLLIIDEAHNFRTFITTEEIKDEENEKVIGILPKMNKRGYKLMEYGTKYCHKVLLLTGTLFINSLYDCENLLAMIDNRPPINTDNFSKVIVNAERIEDYFNYRISYYKTSPESIYFPKMIENIEVLYLTTEQDLTEEDREKGVKAEETEYNRIKLEGRPKSESEKPNNFYQAELYGSNMIGENKKINWIIEKILEQPNQKFIVYSTLYDSGVKLISKKLNDVSIQYKTITGKQTASSKEESKKFFNGYNFGDENFKNKIDEKLHKYINNDYRVLIITKAGAEGVDTINCQNVILLNSLWNDATSEQIIARAVRYKSHFGLPEKDEKGNDNRIVNVYRLLLAKKSNKKIVDTITNPKFKKFCDLKKEINDATKELLKLKKSKEGKVDLSEKRLRQLKTDKGELFIPEKTVIGDKKRFRKPSLKNQQLSVDGWDIYNKKDEEEKKKWRMRLYSEWYGLYGEEKEDNPLKEGLYNCTADILMYILAKSKTENINDFCSLLGNDISLFESYESELLKKIVLIEKKLSLNNIPMTEEFQAHIYSLLLKENNIKFLQTGYEPIPKEERSKEEQLQEYFTNSTLAISIIEQSSILEKEGKIDVLEPTAGDGALIRPLLSLEQDITIDLVEINRTNREQLITLKDKYELMSINLLKEPNFLRVMDSKRYDYIFMNPPFHLRRSENARLIKDVWDFDFVKRAFAFLKRGGELMAIVGTHFLLDEKMVDWYEDIDFKTFKYEFIGKQSFKPLKGRAITYEPIIIKIVKKIPKNKIEEEEFAKMENDIIGINFYKDFLIEEKEGKEILENEKPITDIIKPKKPEKEEPEKPEKEEPKKPEKEEPKPPTKKPYILIEDEPPVLPEPKPEITDKKLENAEEKIKEEIIKLHDLGKDYGAVFYDASSFIQSVGYIALIMKYEKKCAIITKDIKALRIGNKYNSLINKEFFNNAEKLSNDLLDCIERKDEIIGIPIGINFAGRTTGHANMLIYRPFQKTIERFEPHGQKTGTKDDSNEVVEKVLKEMFEEKMKPYLGKKYTPKFISASQTCPQGKSGLQTIEGQFNKRMKQADLTKEGGGFCGMWSLFILELAFLNPSKNASEILKISYSVSKEEPEYIKNIIRGYVLEIEKLLNDYIKKIDTAESFNFKNSNKFTSKKSIVQNQLLHLLASWDSKSSIREKLEENENKNKSLKPIEDLLKTKSKLEINDMSIKLRKSKFNKNFTKEDMIQDILDSLKDKKHLNLTEKSIIEYFKYNKLRIFLMKQSKGDLRIMYNKFVGIGLDIENLNIFGIINIIIESIENGEFTIDEVYEYFNKQPNIIL